MSNKYSNPGSNDWLTLQQQMMNSWLQALGQATPNQKSYSANNSFVNAMTQWWNTVSSNMPDGNQELMYKIMEQARVYYVLGEQFSGLLNIINDTGKAATDWQQSLNDQMEQLKDLFTNSQDMTQDAMHGVLGAWQQLPMDTLQRTFSSASLMPGDFMQDMKPEAIDSVTDKFLSIPGVGYTREHQERIQEGVRLWNEYQKVSAEYNTQMNKIAINALDAMRLKIMDMSEKKEEITSLRQIYDLWVDCNEDAYADYAYSDEFSKLYGELTNALMAVKHHGRTTIDEVLSALSMPNHKTMNTLQKRQQEIRREQKKNELVIDKLQKELAELKQQGITGNVETTANKKNINKRVKKKKKVAKKKNEIKPRKKKTTNKKTSKKKSGKKSTSTKPEKIVIKI